MEPVRLRFSAARRPQGLHVTASRVRRAVLPFDDDEDWSDDEPLEVIDGELTLPPIDPDKPVVAQLPPRFKVGFGKDDGRPLPPRSI